MGLAAKVRLRICLLSSNLKHEEAISWPREDEEESVSGEE